MQFYQFEYTKGTLAGTTDHREWFASERAAVVRRLEMWNAGVLTGKRVRGVASSANFIF